MKIALTSPSPPTKLGERAGVGTGQGHRLHFLRFGRMLVDVGRRPEATSICQAQLAQWDSRQIYDTPAYSCRFQADFQTNESFAHKAKPPLPPYLPIAADTAHFPGLRIFQAQPRPTSVPATFPVTLGRSSLAQSFVRTHSVVAAYPTIGSPLLGSHGARGRSRQIGFQFPVHLLVRSILFGMARRNKFHLDSQRRPPSAQTRKPRWPARSKGAAIVHANNPWQTKALEQPHKDCTRTPPSLVGQQPHRQKIPTEQIPHGQGLDPLPVRRSEPAFEIGRPYLIGPRRHRQRRPRQPKTSRRPWAPPPRQLPAGQPQRDRAHRRKMLPGKLSAQALPNFLCTPAPMAAAQPFDGSQPTLGRAPGRPLGPTRSIAHSAPATLPKALPPLVTRFPTDPKNSAHSDHGFLGLQQQFHKTSSRLNQSNRFPGHGPEKKRHSYQFCYPCLCPQVLPMSLPRAVRSHD